jgi:carboxyl-terminal processing protease
MISKKFKALVLVLVLFTGISAVAVQNDKLFEISKNLEIFINVYKELNTNFVDELDPSVMMRTAIDAMVGSLDPYTNYISESQVESYRLTQDEKYQGIGARVGLVDGIFTILEPYAGGPATEAGLKAGDQIISIENTDISGKTLDEINGIIRGVPGTEVLIHVKKTGKKETVPLKLTRGEVNIPNVPYSGLVSDDIGYIQLTVFTQNAGANISKALKDMKNKNPDLKGIILDLRNNGGGLLHEAINICNIFIPSGEELVTTKGKIKERDQSYKTMNIPVDTEIPVAVLIDRKSASASEIVSGVMQDLDRGVLIGQRSFGKGLVQNTREVGYNSRLKLTTSKYYIPSGRCIQGVEYENGEPKDIPDNKRSVFRTKNGRTVLDGGGVTPDIRLEPAKLHPLTEALLQQHLVFKFVNEYCQDKDSIEDAGIYKFTDYEKFLSFAKKQKFSFESEAEKHLSKMKLSLPGLIEPDALSAEISKIEEKIQTAKQAAWNSAKKEIVTEIEKEIVTRYHYQSGRSKHTLAADPEVKEAIKVLSDPVKYKNILGKK